MIKVVRNFPKISNVEFDENIERLRVVIPEKRKWLLVILFSISVIIWITGVVWGISFTIQEAFAGERYTFPFTVMLIILVYSWWRLGRRLWSLWQYYMADREILYFDKDDKNQMILRRPVFIFGQSEAFALEHMSPFYYSDRHNQPAFDYGSQHVYFASPLRGDDGQALVTYLNERYHPHADEDDDEDDE